MDKICEFCMAFSPIVYCNADAAHLCLSCDAKVHSANALSYRHPRTLVCESCRYRPASVRCFDHEMFMCQSCDSSHHVSLQHHKKVIGCYVGCPSAKDLAAFWGFDLNDQSEANRGINDSSQGSGSRRTKVVKDENRRQNTSLILQQIIDLERLQLNESTENPFLVVHGKEQEKGQLSLKHDDILKTLDDHMEPFEGNIDFQHVGDETAKGPFSPAFPEMENLTNTGNPLHGDSFWQCKSPAQDNEIWLQNMQELGVCDELRCFDDVDIPDVDLTFRNFEELFGGEHEGNRTPVEDEATACSFAKQHLQFGESEKAFTSMSEDWIMEQSIDVDKEIGSLNQLQHYPRSVRPSYSASSMSVSRITAESSCSDYKEDGISPAFSKQQLPDGSTYENITKMDGKENVVMRHKEKKVLRHGKQAQYAPQKSKTDGRRRGKGLVLKIEGHEYDSASVAHM